MPRGTATERTLQARAAAHALHALGGTNTGPAREAFLAGFERQVDPNGELSPTERARRAEHARKAYFARLALRSSQARRARREQEHDVVDHDVLDVDVDDVLDVDVDHDGVVSTP